ncbi:MAG: helix-turn-helix transcriptional regulator [Burkholderiales bacterium]|nr:helix-turn-helix transcriptional regulator [Burkholderiales bacterium]
MLERAANLDFEIRREGAREALDLPHRHEYFQIQVNLAGDTTQHIGATVRPFNEGMVSFVLPYRIHWVPHPPGSRYYIISFGQRFLRPDLDTDPLDLEDVPLERAPELAPFILQDVLDFPLDGAERARALALCEAMQEENRRRGFYSMELIRANLLLLIGLVCRRHQDAIAGKAVEQTARRGRRDAMARVMRHVREHLAERLSLEDAAAAAFLSPNYLAHLIKKETGRTFVELVTERRMERAQELLVNTESRVSEIAHASGFADEAYFSRRFRQLVGQSPLAFRAAARRQGALGHDNPRQ